MKDAQQQLYIRERGIIRGPFSPAELAELAQRGRLTRYCEISDNRRDWCRADSLSALFPEKTSGPQSQIQGTPGRNGRTGKKSDESIRDTYALASNRDDSGINAPSGESTVANGTDRIHTDSDRQFLVRVRGEIRGPFELKKLHALMKRGIVGRHDELSLDGLTWVQAGSWPEFFSPVEKKESQPTRKVIPPEFLLDRMLRGELDFKVEIGEARPREKTEQHDSAGTRASQFFVRYRDTVYGPWDRQLLSQLGADVRRSPFCEISVDRNVWHRAAQRPEWFQSEPNADGQVDGNR